MYVKYGGVDNKTARISDGRFKTPPVLLLKYGLPRLTPQNKHEASCRCRGWVDGAVTIHPPPKSVRLLT